MKAFSYMMAANTQSHRLSLWLRKRDMHCLPRLQCHFFPLISGFSYTERPTIEMHICRTKLSYVTCEDPDKREY